MAISKLILNGVTQMDVTSDTVSAGKLISGITATKNDGTKVTGTITTKSSADLTASGSTVTVPAGYYSVQATKNVASVTHPNPTAAFVSSTGAFTATHTQSAGYVAAGATTSTLNLTTRAAQTIYTSTADQTIASNRWLTGAQTIKSVTISNLTADAIANGVVIKVGDTGNASRISQVTGTYAPTTSSLTVVPTETQQTFNATGVYGYKPVTVNGISSTYVGTGIARRDGENTTFTDSTGAFYGPSGYYTEAFTRMITTQAAQTIYPSTADQTVASYKWLTGTQTIKSVMTTNLTAENIAEGVTVKVGDSINASRIAQITGTHQGGGGGNITVDQIAMRTISGSISGNATLIGSYAFTNCYSLTSANFPSATLISGYAFANCSSLTSVSFPLVASIGTFAFANCYSLTSANFPSATVIDTYAFSNCSSLTSVSFPLVTSIDTYAFANCSNLTFVNFPSAITIGWYAFANCSSLTSVSFPLVREILSYAFSCCYRLTFVSFPSATVISTYAFKSCYNLLSVYLMGSSITSLVAKNAFSATPISEYTTSTGGVYGSIFVPASLYDSYITATNWSVYSARIVSV